ncbi:hypothetical protein K493DRAFT_333800 [Basidiobolus meristosporus CBS 931.73]|uniref:Pre-rRNA-processing protein RIX1 n=1 Tax=Basidiobolus meristosporus CBS 931.73 TaxID=1314790 RepID=A0A1Y1Z3J6_9FUNG|nr:hypothetical protein K493DRAFT_333800 [Basidiobolus meristosporus CBS 931.73]|eukprot:ORY04850.1 hypothetical protein K493DRAFT_333800 [Basidiobolus meristosporus CBS 931.73]
MSNSERILVEHAKLLNSLINHYLSTETAVGTHVPYILETITYHGLLENDRNDELDEAIHKWETRVTSLLQSKIASARWAGVSFVKISLDNNELYNQNVTHWVSALLSSVMRPEPTPVLESIITTLSELFKRTARKPEFQREVTTAFLPRFNVCLLSLSENQELLPCILRTLRTSVETFPSIFKPSIDKTQALCLRHLDGSMDSQSAIVAAASACLVSLHNASGKVNSVDAWRATNVRLIGSIHQALDLLFDSVEEGEMQQAFNRELVVNRVFIVDYQKKDNLLSYDFMELPSDYVQKFPLLFNRVKALLRSLSASLSCKAERPVSIPVSSLIDLFCRIYNVSDSSVMSEDKDKSEFHALMAGIPSLHVSTTSTLESLVTAAGDHLLCYSNTLSSMILKSLNQHKGKEFARVSAYGLATVCIETFGFGFSSIIDASIIKIILQDTKALELKAEDILSKKENNTSKKQPKRRKANVTNSDALTAQHKIVIPSSALQHAALRTLKAVIISSGSSIAPQLRTAIESTLISHILTIAQEPSESANENIEKFKLSLYDCLLSVVISPAQQIPLVLPYALKLFNQGLNDSSYMIRAFCSNAVLLCDLIIHPRLPPTLKSPPKDDKPPNGLQPSLEHRPAATDFGQSSFVEFAQTKAEPAIPESVSSVKEVSTPFGNETTNQTPVLQATMSQTTKPSAPLAPVAANNKQPTPPRSVKRPSSEEPEQPTKRLQPTLPVPKPAEVDSDDEEIPEIDLEGSESE